MNLEPFKSVIALFLCLLLGLVLSGNVQGQEAPTEEEPLVIF